VGAVIVRGLRVLWLLLLLGGVADARPALIIYPGSFDPPHLTHVAELRGALAELRRQRADEVVALVLPNHDRPIHVPDRRYVFDKGQRRRLLELAFEGQPGVTVREAFADGTSTVRQLHAIVEQHRRTHDVYLLVGSDAYRSIPSWRGHGRLLGELSILVSTAPEAVAALPPPDRIFDELRGRSRATRSPAGRSFVIPGGQRITYLPIQVPAIHSRPIVVRLLAGKPPPPRTLPPRVRRELRRPEYWAAVAGMKQSLAAPRRRSVR
jgi:nicotinic acid mononucleotide adenylyltransferase